jgi:hypothetical protein
VWQLTFGSSCANQRAVAAARLAAAAHGRRTARRQQRGLAVPAAAAAAAAAAAPAVGPVVPCTKRLGPSTGSTKVEQGSPGPAPYGSSASICSRQAGLSFDKPRLVMKVAFARRPRAVHAATPADPRQAGSGVQLGPPAGHGDQLRAHGGGQLVLKLPPFRRARSSTAPEQRTGPMLLAPRCSAPRGLGQRPRCLCLGATGASHGPPAVVMVGAGWLAALCLL